MRRVLLLLLVLAAIPIGLSAQGTSWQTATLINNGATVSGEFDNTHTEAWYKINVTQEGKIDLIATATGTLTLNYSNSTVYGYWDNDIRRVGIFAGGFSSTITYQSTNAGTGTYYIKVVRYSGSGGYSLKYTFTPCSLANDPEPNNDYEHAGLLQSGQTAQGRLGYRNSEDFTDNEDWYKIVVPQEGHIELIVTGTEDLTLNYSNSTVYGYWDDDIRRVGIFAGGYNDTITYQSTNVGRGTYYIKIQRYTGSGGYRLKYTFTACPLANDPEPNNDYEHASQLQSGQTAQGRLGYCNSENFTDDVDWYKIVVPQEGHIELIVTGTENLTLNYSNSTVYGYWDNDIRRVGIFTGGYNDTITYKATNVGKGTYYIKIQRYTGSGGYRLKYTFTACPLANDPEPVLDDYEHATLLQSGQTVTGRLGYCNSENITDNEDWYKIVVPQEGHIELIVTGTEDLTLNYSNSTVYGYWDDDIRKVGIFAGGYNDTITYNATNVGKGTYYIRIYRYSGSGGYRLKYTLTPCPLANDDEAEGYADAQTVLNGQTVTGRLGYRTSANVTDDEDWYKIDVPGDGIVRLSVTGTEDLKLNYSNSTVYGFWDDDIRRVGIFAGGYSDTITFERKDRGKGTYYIKIYRYTGSGGYKLHYDFIANNYTNDPEPNEDDEHAAPLTYGTTVRGHLGYTTSANVLDDKDIYTVELGEFAMFRFSTDTASTLSVHHVTLRNNSGKSYSIYPGKNGGTLMRDDLEPGTYYLEVVRYSGCGGYTVDCGNNEPVGGTDIKVSWIGRDKVRIGIPCEYTVKLENTSDNTSEFFFLPIYCTPDIEFLGAKLPGKDGYVEELPMDSIGIVGDSIMWFVVPPMAPHETYSFNIIAQGVVNPTNMNKAPGRIVFTSTSAIVIAGLIVYNVAVDYAGDEVISFCTEVINEQIDLTEEELDLYRHKNPDVYRQMVEEKERTGVGVKVGKRVTKTLVTNALSVIPGGQGINFAGELIETCAAFGKALWRRLDYLVQKDLGYFSQWEKEWKAKWHGIKQGVNGRVTSWDPNEMVGPVGYGDENYVPQTSSVTYRILFENKKEATAPAYRIRISDVLDENVFDVSSVHFEGTSHDADGYNWIMRQNGNTLSWDIEGIELPPNVNAPEGEGYVAFSVNLLPGLEHLAEFKNKATIIFDYNAPIETNEYVNTLDLECPVATMVSARLNGDSITISCRGRDDGSGVSSYRYYAAIGDGEFRFIDEVASNETTFTVPEDVNPMDYKFYALAVDNVGNVQEFAPDAIGVTAGVKGDVNGDGEVSVADINAILDMILKATGDLMGDVNEDGEITVADINAVLNIILSH